MPRKSPSARSASGKRSFIHDDFLLHSRAAQRLFHDYAEPEPILDYHSHLSPADIAGDRQFTNLTELWLEGDHYKWRAMRAYGVPERLCSGEAPAYDRLSAWARTVPHTLRNPLYHWTHLELKRYFGISTLLSEATGKTIWEQANRVLQERKLSAQSILRKFHVRAVCTTDDPCDDLACHSAVNRSRPGFRMYPTFRPDHALSVDSPDEFNAWVERLEQASNVNISSFGDFLSALNKRHDYFHRHGCRLSDHGLAHCYSTPYGEGEAAGIFARVRNGSGASEAEHECFASFLMLFFGRLDAERGWTKQLHLGALRGANTRLTHEIGRDSGFDSIGDWPQAASLCRYLDLLERDHALPQMIVYNVNPAENYAIATALGNFQEAGRGGKLQFGSAWWFLDQKDGIESQLNTLSNVGLLGRFIGMLTDSRSFMSFPRHEYFRRVLCNLLGTEMENGELPNDEKLVGTMVRNICFANARDYLGLELAPESELPK